MTAAKKMLTVAEFCQEYGIAESTFYDWRAKGLAPRCAKLPNGQLRIRRPDAEDWFNTKLEAA